MAIGVKSLLKLHLSMPGEGEFVGPDAITRVAELSSLAEAWDDAWYVNKGAQWLIQSLHEASGTSWYASTPSRFHVTSRQKLSNSTT